jgi:DNA-binding transcriptional MerR regulator
MSDTKKLERIKALRDAGYSSAEIAKVIGLREATIRVITRE